MIHQLKLEIADSKWILGAINLDEDLHFSSYYLRSSISGKTDIPWGYTKLLAFYDNFNERYYVLEDECNDKAQKIIDKMLSDRCWFDMLLSNIMKKVNLLAEVFSDQIDYQTIKNMSNKALVDLYQKQYIASQNMYIDARIPEMLDRGTMYFTNYLLNYLRSKTGRDNVNDIFYILIDSKKRSIFTQAQIELIELVKAIKRDICKSKRDTLMNLSPKSRQAIKCYLEKWKYLDYHGYGNKELLTENAVVQKIINIESNNLDIGFELHNKEDCRDDIITKLSIPMEYVRLYEYYSQISLTKLYRKYFQIRNFYFLDMILEEMSYRMGKKMAFIRSMLPEEIITFFTTGIIDDDNIEKRYPTCAYYIDNRREILITEENIVNELALIVSNNDIIDNDGDIMGYPASKGVAVGKCVWINRKEDGFKFQAGNIILSDSADPDIFNFVIQASAIATIQGGVTSHAAILCREAGIPALIHVNDLNMLSDGMTIKLDADKGIISILNDDIEIEHLNDNPKKCGLKAQNLAKILELGYLTPEFITFKFDKIAGEDAAYNRNLSSKIIKHFELSDSDLLIIRSSGFLEDSDNYSGVGKYHSVLNVRKETLPSALAEFYTFNRQLDYSGGVIIQRMIPFTYCGVSISGDERLNNPDYITIEFCEGERNRVTEGRGINYRVIYSKSKAEIQNCNYSFDKTIPSHMISSVISYTLDLEKQFKKRIDIEWGYINNVVYILQVRPIVFRR